MDLSFGIRKEASIQGRHRMYLYLCVYKSNSRPGSLRTHWGNLGERYQYLWEIDKFYKY